METLPPEHPEGTSGCLAQTRVHAERLVACGTVVGEPGEEGAPCDRRTAHHEAGEPHTRRVAAHRDAVRVEDGVVQGPHRSEPAEEREDRAHSVQRRERIGEEVDDLDHGEREQGQDSEVVHVNLRVRSVCCHLLWTDERDGGHMTRCCNRATRVTAPHAVTSCGLPPSSRACSSRSSTSTTPRT